MAPPAYFDDVCMTRERSIKTSLRNSWGIMIQKETFENSDLGFESIGLKEDH